MKTILKTRLTAAILRLAASFQVASLRITLDGKLQCLEVVTDSATRHAMRAELFALRCRLEAAEARLISLQPRRSWRTA